MRLFRTNILLTAVVALTCAQARADTTLFQTGFESPVYTSGASLAGQDGWFGDTIPTVQNAVANGGAQAVAADSTGVAGQHLTLHTLSYSSVANPEKIVTIGVDFMTPSPGTVHWTAIGQLGDAGFLGQMIARQDGLVGSDVGLGPAFTYGQWQRYETVLDFGSRTMTALLDGTPFATGPMLNASTDLTDVGLGISNTLPDVPAIAYWDNLSVVSSAAPVPEPATMSLLAAGGLALLRRRRK